MTWRYGSARLLLRTVWNRLRHRSDLQRWSALENYDQSWDARTAALAALIPPGSRVLEFGAGRRQLERFLPSGCRYQPADLVSRGADAIVCDLNAAVLPTLKPDGFDVAVFSGVLEYVVDVPRMLAWLRPIAAACVVSYNCAPAAESAAQRVITIKNRLAAAWVNHYTERDLVDVFAAAGFGLRHRQMGPAIEGDEALYVFERLSKIDVR